MKTLLEIKNLNITFNFNEQTVNAVRNSSFKINKGECLAIVGESGSGKSVTVLAIMKVGKRWTLVREILKNEDILDKSLIALNVGMPNQIIQYASQYKRDFMPYFSLILIRFDNE